MNDMIDPQDDLRDLIAVDYREEDNNEERFESPTMSDYLEG
jgi:hypothetical protein